MRGGGVAARLRRLSGSARAWLPQLAALGYAITQDSLGGGEAAALNAAMFGLGLWWLPNRPLSAGLCFAVLTFKPECFILLPVALAAGRYYRALIATAFFTAMLLALSMVTLGPQSWLAFFGSMEWPGDALMQSGPTALADMPSLFAALRRLDVPLASAFAGQIALTLLAAGFLLPIWHGTLPYEIKAAAVVFATVAVTPDLHSYDLTMLGLGVIWLLRDGVARGFAPWAPLLIALTWYAASINDYAAPLALPFVPVLCLVTVSVLRRARSPSGGG